MKFGKGFVFGLFFKLHEGPCFPALIQPRLGLGLWTAAWPWSVSPPEGPSKGLMRPFKGPYEPL